ncbi:MAG: hypothetical protein R3324_12285 [Halobacteriales archaeon]|nr:hypothetical protein [Halobacteriales archaeon]
MVPGLRDNQDELVDRLGRLITILERKEFGGGQDIDITENITRNSTVNVDEPERENTGDYFSTGLEPISVGSTEEWILVEFGLMAQAVNLRFDDAIHVAFSNPERSTGKIIPLGAGDSPFSMGGDRGIGTAFMWVRKNPTASSNPTVHIIGYA